jgi:hypothetical protein
MMTATWRGTAGALAEVVEAGRVGIGNKTAQCATHYAKCNRAPPSAPGNQRTDTAAACFAFNSSAKRIVRAISSCNPTRYRAASAFNGSICACKYADR